MMQHRANEDSAPLVGLPTEAEILHKWYAYAARQPESIGSLLQLLRIQQQQSEEQQQLEFQVSAANFAKLQSMRPPRAHCFISDAQRIATACQVNQVFRFIQTLLLARNLADQHTFTDEGEAYEAAFDAPVFDQGQAEQE